ncbi:uncharacterized protein RAG0_07397 [Rhynchosporium agropyri]|uniref:Cardiolipin synthase N-terminal domain-containing protein n=3 Tax=Rhynchosporium TaxID=38037 RepID=A0A1E1MU98_RHYSE|nr:uncharacterized protein RAG0_07397 [Rhynchosporium agropyri]CZT12214.1 uncharacterized protein RCO7_10454 [Rhynchosporium commune]CZT52395.1 uncharacterized protein RSE6_13729 [Rhynchosporium secalis]
MYTFQAALSFLLLAATTLAQPISTEVVQENAWKYGTGGGIVGFIVLILDIMVFLEVLKSNREVLPKLLWCVLVFVFPIGGLIIYYLFSNRAEHNTTGGYETLPQ